MAAGESARSWRQWLGLLGVAAAYAVAFALARRALDFSLTSPWFVLVAMICFLWLASVALPVIPLRMPAPLGAIRQWETQRGAYHALGVPAFGRLLRRTPLRLLNLDVYLGGGVSDAARLRAQLEAAEVSHALDAVLVLPYMAYAAAQGEWATLAWFSLARIAANAYPVMHLRLTRHRLDRLASREARRRP